MLIHGITSSISGGFTQPASADFNGSTQYIHWNTSPHANSNLFSAVIKFKRGSTGVAMALLGFGGRVDIRFNGVNTLTVACDDTGNTNIFTSTSAAAFTDTADAHVLMVSVNTTTQTASVYIDNTSYLSASPSWVSTNAINLVRGLDIAASGAAVPIQFFDGCEGPVWVSDNEYIDFTDSANRDLVITAPGVITDPGTDGANWSPTSTAPELYIADTLNAPGTNSGTGSNPTSTPGTPYSACT